MLLGIIMAFGNTEKKKSEKPLEARSRCQVFVSRQKLVMFKLTTRTEKKGSAFNCTENRDDIIAIFFGTCVTI